MTSPRASTDIDLLAPALVAEPNTALNALRETAAVVWSDRLGAWLVTRYDEVRAGFKAPQLSSDRITPVYARRLAREGGERHRNVYEVLSRFIVFTDPPQHTRLRKLLEYAFRPRAIARMDGIVSGLVDELVASIATRDKFDFLHDFADPLPVRVIASMFGVPREHHEDMREWSQQIVSLLFGALDVPDREERAREGLAAFTSLIADIVERRRRDPGDDLISDLIAAQDADDTLTTDEIVATCVLLLFAGHETTRNLLANGMKALLDQPEQWQRLVADPSLADSAVEEILRYDGPIKAMWRHASEPLALGGQSIEAGERVLLLNAAANRDPRRFDNPNEFDIRRTPNYHVGFGYSIHYCMGAAIARLEGRLALAALARSLPSIARATDTNVDELRYEPFIVTRALKSLPLTNATSDPLGSP
jgi:cytochrome P450